SNARRADTRAAACIARATTRRWTRGSPATRSSSAGSSRTCAEGGNVPPTPQHEVPLLAGAVGAEQRFYEGEIHARGQAIASPAVFAGVETAFEGRGVAQQIAYARDEPPHPVLGVRAFGARSSRRTENLVGAQT